MDVKITVTLGKMETSWYGIRSDTSDRWLFKYVECIFCFPEILHFDKVHPIKYIKYLLWQWRLWYFVKDFLFVQLVNVEVFPICFSYCNKGNISLFCWWFLTLTIVFPPKKVSEVFQSFKWWYWNVFTFFFYYLIYL